VGNASITDDAGNAWISSNDGNQGNASKGRVAFVAGKGGIGGNQGKGGKGGCRELETRRSGVLPALPPTQALPARGQGASGRTRVRSTDMNFSGCTPYGGTVRGEQWGVLKRPATVDVRTPDSTWVAE
jgi:hypothetical protein